MRTPLSPLLFLLTPVLAFAQGGVAGEPSRSPLFWFWVALLAVAVAFFIWRTVAISKRRHVPPGGPGTTSSRTRDTGGPRTPRTT